MPDSTLTLARARALLREGRVQEADDLITQHFREDAAAGNQAAAAAEPPPAPRDPMAVVHDLFAAVIALLGNKDELLELLKEFRAVL